MADTGVDKQQYVIDQANNSFTTSDGGSDDLSKWANNEISEAQNAYKYYQSMGDTKGMEESHARAENARNVMGYYGSADGGTLNNVDQQYVDNQVAQQKQIWNEATAKGDKKTADKAHASAERYRQLLGGVGGADGSQSLAKSDLDTWVDNEIAAAKERWRQAYEAGDQEGMAIAHYDAEFARAHKGFSGGADGSQNLNIYNGANYESDINTPFVATSTFGSTPDKRTSTGGTNSGRTEVTLGGNKYWMDSNGVLYDSEGNLIGSGYNSATNSLTYTDENQATQAALKVLEDRYGVKGWDGVLKRMNLTSIPDELIRAAMSGTLSSYINNFETGNNNGTPVSSLNNSTLYALLDAYIAQNGAGGNQYITPDQYNVGNPYALSPWADGSGTMATGYPSNITNSPYGQYVARNLERYY